MSYLDQKVKTETEVVESLVGQLVEEASGEVVVVGILVLIEDEIKIKIQNQIQVQNATIGKAAPNDYRNDQSVLVQGRHHQKSIKRSDVEGYIVELFTMLPQIYLFMTKS